MRLGILAACAAVVMIGAAAQAETYVCKVTPIGRDMGWIAKTIAINIDRKTNEVLVSDGIILAYHKKPIQGRLLKTTEKRVTVAWDVLRTKSATNQNAARFVYRASYFKQTHKFMITGRPSGYHNSFSGRGKCELRK